MYPRASCAYDINLDGAGRRIVGQGEVVPLVGLQLKVAVGEVAVAGGNLNLVAWHTGVSNTHEEIALDTHHGGDEAVEVAGADSLKGQLRHTAHHRRVLPVDEDIVLLHVGHDIDEGTGAEDEVIGALRLEQLQLRCSRRDGQHIDGVAAQAAELQS